MQWVSLTASSPSAFCEENFLDRDTIGQKFKLTHYPKVTGFFRAPFLRYPLCGSSFGRGANCGTGGLYLQTLERKRGIGGLYLQTLERKRGIGGLYLQTPERKMDYLWTPWRYQYITNATANEKLDCIFCDAARRQDDATTLVVHRGVSSFAILNRFPYTSGHLMIVPYPHVAEISGLDTATLTEIMTLAQRVENAFKSLYKPDGMNFGMNLGRAAGAGIAGHVHLHALPRWIGDASFMSVAAETRVLPEDLSTTFQRLRSALE